MNTDNDIMELERRVIEKREEIIRYLERGDVPSDEFLEKYYHLKDTYLRNWENRKETKLGGEEFYGTKQI